MFGAFVLLTLMLAGAALGRVVGLSAIEGVYLTVFLLAFLGWIVNRCTRRSEDAR